MCILALADDMTGALEVGTKFSAAGIETIVSANPAATVSAQTLVLDTETRHLSAAEAGRVVRGFVTRSGVKTPRLIYKKTDSSCAVRSRPNCNRWRTSIPIGESGTRRRIPPWDGR